MNIEEARDILANVIADEIIGTYCLNEAQKYNCDYCENDDCIYNKAIETVLKELDKKDKVIDMMNQHIYENTYRDLEECEFEEHYQIKCKKNCKECAKEYFYNKAEVL